MRKLGEESRFEQTRDFIERELEVVGKRTESEKLEVLENKLKDLNEVLKKIEEKLLSNHKLNRSDVKKKIDNYRQESKELRDRLEAIILEYKKKLLLKKASSRSQQTHQENIELLEDLYQRNRNI